MISWTNDLIKLHVVKTCSHSPPLTPNSCRFWILFPLSCCWKLSHWLSTLPFTWDLTHSFIMGSTEGIICRAGRVWNTCFIPFVQSRRLSSRRSKRPKAPLLISGRTGLPSWQAPGRMPHALNTGLSECVLGELPFAHHRGGEKSEGWILLICCSLGTRLS